MRHRNLYVSALVDLGMDHENAENFVKRIEKDSMEDAGEFGIRVDWTSGDSFSSYPEHDEIILPWKNAEIAKENAERLQKHVCMYDDLERAYTESSRRVVIEKWAAAEWVVVTEERPRFAMTEKLEGGYLNTNSIRLLKDDGSEFQISADNWLGYFETGQRFEAAPVTECLA